MIGYIIRRLIISVFLLLGISLVSFIVIQLPPGDPASSYENFLIQRGMTRDQAVKAADQIRDRYGLNDPAPTQFIKWVWGIVSKGEFGFSFAYRRDVGELVLERLPKTLMLALLAHAISTLVGVYLGIYVAPRQYGAADNFFSVLALLFTSIPRFFLALAIMYMLVFVFDQTNVTSFFSPTFVLVPWFDGAMFNWAKLWDLIKHIWPVVLIAGLGGIARNMRTMRGNLLDVLNAQYVTTARSKGLREAKVMNRHAVPNALHPIVAYQGTVLPYMIQGELEAAIVMNIPSVGPMFYDSLVTQDVYLSAGFLLMISALVVLGNLIADLAMAVLDPRIRYS
jgi:peptide/nickel transport system permease protein